MRPSRHSLLHCFTFALLLLLALARAHPQARFDLDGPRIDMHVTRAGVSLPIATVPNLQPGDQIWLHPDLPPTQSVHFLLIAVFLRGTTNPPPDQWFIRIETWQRKVREEGVSVTVPAEAQQALLFLAPETGGDFSTLRSAVQGRPGVFVRASQDLTEAGFEQARIDTYLAAMKPLAAADPAEIQLHSNLLARTLNLRPNPECFKRSLDQQYNCLTQTGTQTLLDDGHGQSLLTSLSTGPSSDFINAASATRLAAGGNYSAYVGALVDFAHILATLHTAQYQYIPALATPKADALNLRLNTPPSFHNPKSVIVIGLPAIQKAEPPPLRPADPTHISCLLDPHLILPVEGAPLVFSTAFAHQLVLHLSSPQPDTPRPQDIPLTADAFSGGLTLAPAEPTRSLLPVVTIPNLGTKPASNPAARGTTSSTALPSAAGRPALLSVPGTPTTGVIQGMWGFDPFTGPTLALQQTPGTGWHIVSSSDTDPPSTTRTANLIAGQPNHLQLQSTGTACIQSIAIEPDAAAVAYKLANANPEPPRPAPTDASPDHPIPAPATKPAEMPAKPAARLPTKPQPVDLTLNLQHDTTPGALRLAILQFGQQTPDQLGTQIFAQPAKIDSLRLHAGDRTATLTGSSLDQVATLTLPDLTYTPASSPEPTSTLELTLSPETKSPTYKPAQKLTAQVHLHDGRKLEVSTTILPARPAITLLSRRATSETPSPIQLSTPADLALGAQLHFFLKSKEPFPRTGQIEIASQDQSLHTSLNLAAGTLILEDAHTLLATFDPLKLFGPSTFGPFRIRAVLPPTPAEPQPTEGDWLPLATIVRLPVLTALTCPTLPSKSSKPTTPPAPAPPAPPSCTLTGENLFLLDSISPDLAFTTPTPVPEGFVDSSLPLTRPPASTFYLKLRDDPTTAHPATLPITPAK